MAEPKFVALVTAAHAYLTARQETLKSTFHLSRFERWDWDADGGSIVFSDNGIPRVVARAQLVGSVSRNTGTWLWSWANPSIEPHLCRDLPEVRRFGEQQRIWQLTTAKWEADEVDGWEMTSIAAYVLQTKGAYRMPSERLFTFAVLDEVSWAPGAAPSDGGTDECSGRTRDVTAHAPSALNNTRGSLVSTALSRPPGACKGEFVSDWPFADKPNTASLTTRQVLEGAPILLVTHDADDGSWQFLCGTTDDPADVRVVGLERMYKRDPALGELADLPEGWRASRPSVGRPWQRGPA